MKNSNCIKNLENSGDDWSIFFDADTLINPDYFDMTNHLTKDTVAFNGKDQANVRFRYSKEMLRDGRHIGACTWLVVWSDWCTDLMVSDRGKSRGSQVSNTSSTSENQSGLMRPPPSLGRLLLTKNIARFGLKHVALKDIYRIFWCG